MSHQSLPSFTSLEYRQLAYSIYTDNYYNYMYYGKPCKVKCFYNTHTKKHQVFNCTRVDRLTYSDMVHINSTYMYCTWACNWCFKMLVMHAHVNDGVFFLTVNLYLCTCFDPQPFYAHLCGVCNLACVLKKHEC